MRYGDSFTDGQVTKEAILRLVNERRRSAETALMNFFQRTKRWYNIYRGVGSGSFANRHDVVIPILFSQIMSDVTNKCQSIFADNEVVQFIPNNDYEAEYARKVSQLVNIQFAEANSYLKAVDFFMSAAVYGTGVLRTKWDFRTRQKNYRVNIGGQEQIMPSTKTVFDGPNWEVVDILDFLPEPGKRRLEDCNWIIHTYYIDLDDLLELQSGDGVPVFAPEAIMELLDSGMGADARDAWKQRTTTYRTWTDYEARSNTTFSKPVRIDEYWGLVPSEFGVNGDRNLVITVANEKVVLRYEPNPFWEDQKPFLIYTPMPDMHSLHGTGKAEISEKLQATINKLANIKLDSLEIFANPTFFTGDNTGLDTQNLRMAPGKNFKVNGEDVSKVVMPVSPDLRALQMTYEEISQLAYFEQQGVGIPNDVVQGMEGPDRETAYSVGTRKEAALGRLAGEAALAEHMIIVPLAHRMKEYNAQMLPLPKQIRMIGQDAIIDPVSGMPQMDEAAVIGYGDLDYDHSCRALGASRMMSKSMMAQQMMTFMQTAGAMPPVAAMVNWVNFTKMLSKAMGLNPVDLLVPQAFPPEINKMMLEQLVGGGGEQGGMGGVGQLAGALPQGQAVGPTEGGY